MASSRLLALPPIPVGLVQGTSSDAMGLYVRQAVATGRPGRVDAIARSDMREVEPRLAAKALSLLPDRSIGEGIFRRMSRRQGPEKLPKAATTRTWRRSSLAGRVYRRSRRAARVGSTGLCSRVKP